MSRSDDVALSLAVHVNRDGAKAIRVSETGDDDKAVWIPRSLITAFELTGKTTRGFDKNGQAINLEIASVTIMEWKARELGLI